MREIVFTQWREDIYDADCNLVQKDALILRGSLGMLEYHMVVWEETEQEIAACKELIAVVIEKGKVQ